MMILKLTGEVRMGSGGTVVKPQCDLKYLTVSFIRACEWRCWGGESPMISIEMKELEHRKEKNILSFIIVVLLIQFIIPLFAVNQPDSLKRKHSGAAV